MFKILHSSDNQKDPILSHNIFHERGEYFCPVCRHGKIAAMPLMETFACNFCQHIFTTNFDKQLLKMADSQLPLTWYWNGKTWKGIHRDGVDVSWSYFIISIGFVFFPTAIVAGGSYLFPPSPDSLLSWLPVVWSVLTFLLHLSFLIWSIVEYYQFPLFLYVRAVKRRIANIY
jgi:hypothetical protein